MSTAGSQIREHNAGDLTAVVDAGRAAGRARSARSARPGPDAGARPAAGRGGTATIGGVVATDDSGPLRHRYGSARDLVVGITVALSDGTVAKAGGKVIKNVAGYDLAKLFTGSFGTLGAILEVSVRLHPLPPATATAVGRSDRPARRWRPPRPTLSHAPAGAAEPGRALGGRRRRRAGPLRRRGPAPGGRDVAAAHGRPRPGVRRDRGRRRRVWAAQREGQRSERRPSCGSPALQTQLRLLLDRPRLGARVVGRAGLGLSWVTVDGDPVRRAQLRRALAPSPCVVLDARRRALGGGPPGARTIRRARADAAREGALRPRGRLRPGVLAV